MKVLSYSLRPVDGGNDLYFRFDNDFDREVFWKRYKLDAGEIERQLPELIARIESKPEARP